MSIITISDDGKLKRESVRTITLDKSALAALPVIAAKPYYNRTSGWKNVILNYSSGYAPMKDQTFTMTFDTTQTSPVSTSVLPLLFVGDLKISGIIINDFAGGSFVVARDKLPDPSVFDLSTGREIAPSSEILASASLTSGTIGDDIAKWLVGYKVRLYDVGLGEYKEPVNTIIAKNGNILTFQYPFAVYSEMVLTSPNGSKFEVGVTDDGALTTTDTTKAVTPMFKVLATKAVPTDPDVYGQLTVDNSGELEFKVSDIDMGLATVNSYILLSAGSALWRITMDAASQLVMDTSGTDLTGKFLRFATSKDATLDQLRDYSFDY